MCRGAVGVTAGTHDPVTGPDRIGAGSVARNSGGGVGRRRVRCGRVRRAHRRPSSGRHVRIAVLCGRCIGCHACEQTRCGVWCMSATSPPTNLGTHTRPEKKRLLRSARARTMHLPMLLAPHRNSASPTTGRSIAGDAGLRCVRAMDVSHIMDPFGCAPCFGCERYRALWLECDVG